jgi:hypothetical protein
MGNWSARLLEKQFVGLRKLYNPITGASQVNRRMKLPTRTKLEMMLFLLVACIIPSKVCSDRPRFLKSKYRVPVTLLTNDNNLAMKAQANSILTLSSTSPTGEPATSDLLIRQALHGPLPLENTFIRPKEGNDTCMFDLSGTMDDHLKFLPGLNASRYAPKETSTRPGIAINLETGAVVLVDGEKVTDKEPRRHGNPDHLRRDNDTEDKNGVDGAIGKTYADTMERRRKPKSPKSDEEMDWE